ncbi:MAG: Hpt domain-containing protein [Moraxellaceae bacterium]|nr:Hpt domain-containing protein [Moraxellaceae bacterium]
MPAAEEALADWTPEQVFTATEFAENIIEDVAPPANVEEPIALEPLVPEPVPEPLPEPVVAAVVEAPKKPLIPVLTAMPEDDHSFDEEIREIFVEEAEEVMEAINEYFPKWAANFDDTASLLEFRRGFHTLKGSGRMVGAKVVGELAWAFETMLNKVRDKILPPDQVMVSLISECLSVVPGLVEDFANRAAPRINTSPLMEAADAVTAGKALTPVDVARAAARAHGEEEADLPDAADDFDALAASLAPAGDVTDAELADVAAELPVQADVAEAAPAADNDILESDAEPVTASFVEDDISFSVEDTPSVGMMSDDVQEMEAAAPQDDPETESAFSTDVFDADALDVDVSDVASTDDTLPALNEAALQQEEEAAAADTTDSDENTAVAEIDPILLEIFTSEADTHLAELQAYLDGIDPDRSSAAITDEVIRSLHTLKGSAGMAGIFPVADIAAPMEHLFKDLRNQGSNAKRMHLQALQDGHGLINDSIRNLAAGGSGRVDGAEALIAHIRQLDHDRLSLLEREQAEQLGEGSPLPASATAGLVAGFMELGLDNVLDAPWELDGWLHGEDAAERIHVLQEELQRLAPVAAKVDVQPLAQLAERLAGIYGRLARRELALDNELLNDLATTHDELINIFDTLAASQTVQPNEPVLTRLLDLLEMPAQVVSGLNDEPATAAFETDERTSLADRMTDAEVADWEAPADIVSVDSIDPELLEIFLEEADEVLEAADAELDLWRRNPDNLSPLGALQRQLHTLKGGARLAEIRPLGDLAHELEFLYEGLVDGRYTAIPELTDLLQRCHDRLADMVQGLRGRGQCTAAMDLVNAINAFRRDPAGGIVLAGAAEAPAPIVEEVPASAAFAEEALVGSDWLDDAGSVALAETAPEPASESDADVALDSVAQESQEPDDTLESEVFAEEAPVSNESKEAEHDAVFAEFFPDQAIAPVAPEIEPTPEPQSAAISTVAPVIAPPVVAAPPVAAAPVISAEDFDPELLEIFLEEAGEIVDDTSEQLSDWRRDTNNTLPVQQLQRGLHTLKGGARMAEISPLGDLAHHMENIYEALCDGRLSATEPLFSLLNRCHDRLAVAVEALRSNIGCPDTSDLVRLIERYIADPDNFQDTPDTVTLTPVPAEPVAELAAEVTPEPVAAREPVPQRAIEAAPVPENVDSDILEIFLEESEELAEGIETSLGEWLENRDATAPMDALMRHLHTLKGGARLAGLKELGDLAHDWESDLVAIQSGSKLADDAFFAGLGERQDAVLVRIKAIRSGLAETAPAAEPVAPTVGTDSVLPPAADPVADNVTTLPAAATARPVRTGPQAEPPSMQGGFRKDSGARGPQEMIRVPSDLLEKLVNLAGETSITRSRVEMGVHGFAQTVEEMGATIQRLADQLRRMDSEMETQIVARHNEDTGGKYEDFDPLEMDQYSSLNQLSKALSESASDLLDLKSTLIDKARDTETLLLQQSRINTELQEGLMRSRMVPFSRLVPRLKRIVRQTGQEVNKPADLDVINPEGEMDRTLLERIVAPLEHMLRNAVDHGLEDQAGRAAAGKPAQGVVTLTLAREGGEVVLTLADDGRGINIPAVRKKALERGLITEGQDITDQEVIQFIFHAGFSTASAVTQISGRGVGMDVVQSEIKQMGGAVSIQSETGKGTRFIVRLPFTVAVNRALMVRIGEDSYAIPLAQIEGIVRASPYELETYYGPEAPLFEYAGVAYKLNYLGEFVHGVKSPNLVGHVLPLPVLLIRGGEQRIAIQVDQLIGSREIVVKSVGAQLASVAGISGATILGDGSVVIILDVIAMLRAASLSAPRVSVSLDGGMGQPAAAEAKRTRTVMVVDDSVTVRKVTSRLLERHGYEVLLAKDGMDAIAKLEDQKPDLMLLDIEMPRMDGFEVASLVRHNPNLEDLPIIMITSRTGEKHRERAFQIGVNAYMGKPFQEEQLLETIGELLAASTVR